ncbi:MAG: riboflavin kinase [Erysipelotrichaceae bacterium]
MYGQCIKVEFLCCLRKEIKFASITALIAQLEQDKAQAKLYFKNQ